MRFSWALALSVLLLVGCGEVVDNAPAIELGNRWYGANGIRHPFVDLRHFYSTEFSKAVPDWPKALMRLEHDSGPVKKATLTSARMSVMDEHPCFFLDYDVVRSAKSSEERLFVCRTGDRGSAWRIQGHRFRRPDTGEWIEAGYSVVEHGLCVGTNCPGQ